MNGKIHGRGKLETGKFTYEGEWRDGKKHGKGACTYHDNGDDYEGEWAEDKWHGQGVWTLRGADGAVHEKFVGSMAQGRMHGSGQYLYSDGSVYDGEWEDNRMHGAGCFTFANGNKYVGDFIDDAKEGRGVLQYRDPARTMAATWTCAVETSVAATAPRPRGRGYSASETRRGGCDA